MEATKCIDRFVTIRGITNAELHGNGAIVGAVSVSWQYEHPSQSHFVSGVSVNAGSGGCKPQVAFKVYGTRLQKATRFKERREKPNSFARTIMAATGMTVINWMPQFLNTG